MKKSKMIFELWKLLDDIDTASDVFKDNYKGLSNYVFAKQQERHKIVDENYIDKLYNKYYGFGKDYKENKIAVIMSRYNVSYSESKKLIDDAIEKVINDK